MVAWTLSVLVQNVALQLVTLLERDRTAAVQLLDKWTRERTLTSTEAGDLRRALVALLGGL